MTQQDIDKTYACFAADVRMVVKKTGLWLDQETENYLTDVKAFMDKVYLKKIHLILYDGQDIVLKARKYDIGKVTEGAVSSRPGGNNWDVFNGKKLTIVLSYGHQWNSVSIEEQMKFKSERIINWSPSNIDLSFSDLQRKIDKTYTSNELGISRTDLE